MNAGMYALRVFLTLQRTSSTWPPESTRREARPAQWELCSDTSQALLSNPSFWPPRPHDTCWAESRTSLFQMPERRHMRSGSHMIWQTSPRSCVSKRVTVSNIYTSYVSAYMYMRFHNTPDPVRFLFCNVIFFRFLQLSFSFFPFLLSLFQALRYLSLSNV